MNGRDFASRTLRRHVSIAALLLAWLCANGALWDAVQVFAWAKMFRDYSRVMPMAQALALTFDASKPCELCTLAQGGQDATREGQSAAALGDHGKLVLVSLAATPMLLAVQEESWPGLDHEAGLTRTDAVPVPPPRV
jgi:hypothetical protein